MDNSVGIIGTEKTSAFSPKVKQSAIYIKEVRFHP